MLRDKELVSGGMESGIGDLGVAVNVDVDIDVTVKGSIQSIEPKVIETLVTEGKDGDVLEGGEVLREDGEGLVDGEQAEA